MLFYYCYYHINGEIKIYKKIYNSCHQTHLAVDTDFYRAMRCISAVFAVMQCPSVCPSVCHVRGSLCNTVGEDVYICDHWGTGECPGGGNAAGTLASERGYKKTRANQCYLTDQATEANRITFVRYSIALVRSTRSFTAASRETTDRCTHRE